MKNIISSTPNSQLRPEEAATRPCRMSISLSWNFPMRFETRAPMTQRFFPGSTDFRMGRFSDSQISSKVSTNPVLTNQLKKNIVIRHLQGMGSNFHNDEPKNGILICRKLGTSNPMMNHIFSQQKRRLFFVVNSQAFRPNFLRPETWRFLGICPHWTSEKKKKTHGTKKTA